MTAFQNFNPEAASPDATTLRTYFKSHKELKMPDLLYEYWEDETGGTFAPVSEKWDQIRLLANPGARLILSIRAPTHDTAQQLKYDALDYGVYDPRGLEDVIHTAEDVARQDEYLRRRNVL